jgi:predicted PurR-regulated permease PerM
VIYKNLNKRNKILLAVLISAALVIIAFLIITNLNKQQPENATANQPQYIEVIKDSINNQIQQFCSESDQAVALPESLSPEQIEEIQQSLQEACADSVNQVGRGEKIQ